jgi:hypothetical protein
VRLCLAADIERYGRFTNGEAARAQARFLTVLGQAQRRAGLTELDADAEHSGDGRFVVLPPGLDESVVIPNLVVGLSIALRELNADLNAHARLRLRVAMDRGLLAPDVNGWVGNAAITVHRLLDSAPLRMALVAEPAVDFALIVADTLFRDVIAHGYPGLPPELFQKTTVVIPAKQFAEQAWIYPGIHRALSPSRAPLRPLVPDYVEEGADGRAAAGFFAVGGEDAAGDGGGYRDEVDGGGDAVSGQPWHQGDA